LLFLCLITPLLAEAGARVIYAVQYGNAGYLTYPTNAPLAPDAIAISIAVPNDHRPTPRPPGWHAYGPPDAVQHWLPINARGFRGRDVADPKGADLRVVCLGGSSTFSGECAAGESYPEVLEALWNEQLGHGAVEVFNMGMIGYSTAEIAPLLRDEVVGQDVDLVTVCSAYNNLQGLGLLDLREGIAPWHRRQLWGRSLFYTVVYNGWRARGTLNRPWDTMVRRYRADLDAMIDVARDHDVELLFVLQPLADARRVKRQVLVERMNGSVDDLDWIVAEFERASEWHGPLQQEMVDVAERHGVSWIDPRPRLVDHPEPEDHFHAFLHLTPGGSRVMAEEIQRLVDEEYGGLRSLVGGNAD